MTDYSIGFVRYENKDANEERVVWEFDWGTEGLDTLARHSVLGNQYFTTPGGHHQGMFMATRQQLLAWKTRQPDCHFHTVERRPAWHRERISGAMDLYNPRHCNVTQLLPLNTFEDLLIYHMPNKNHRRMPKNVVSVRDLHERRQRIIQHRDAIISKGAETQQQKYNGIQMFPDERNSTMSMHFNLSEFHAFVKNAGRLQR